MHGALAYGEDTRLEVKIEGPEGIPGQRWRPKGSPGGPGPESLGGLGFQVAKGAVQEAQRNRTETCAKRYAQCGLGDTCVQRPMNYCRF